MRATFAMLKSYAQIIAILFLALVTSCTSGDEPLRGGFRLLTIYGNTKVLIDKNNKVVVQEKVKNVFVTSNYIFGERVTPDNFDPNLHSSVFGCFALNIDTKTLNEGFSKDEFLLYLKRQNVLDKVDIGHFSCATRG